jgi:prepilin-type N-terminal cleavage/methylation domain-containing protein
MNGIKAFTLIELLVSVVLTGIMSFFLYGMVTYSYSNFIKLSSHSGNFDDIKNFIFSLRNSVMYINSIESTGKSFKLVRYGIYHGSNVKIVEEYKFLDDNRFESSTFARAVDLETIPESSYPSKRGELYKYTTIYEISGAKKIAFQTKVSTCIRKIFYFYDSGMNRLDMYVIYDDVVGGVIGQNETYVTKGQWLCYTIRNKLLSY